MIEWDFCQDRQSVPAHYYAVILQRNLSITLALPKQRSLDFLNKYLYIYVLVI